MEVETNVFVGKVNARIRDALWEEVQKELTGQYTMAYSMKSPQGFELCLHNFPSRHAKRLDGLQLVSRPLPSASKQEGQQAKTGWSKASRYRRYHK